MSTPVQEPNTASARSFRFSNPNFDDLGRHIFENAQRGFALVEQDCHADERGAAVCAPGPTLLKPSSLRRLRDLVRRGWRVVAIKEAIALLEDKKIPVHYSASMDPDANQVKKTPRRRAVVYCVASSCHPALFEHLAGHEIRIFHSCCGWKGRVTDVEGKVHDVSEVHLYKSLYGRADTIIGGYTVVNRAVGLAKYMGLPKVAVFGAPFGWREDSSFYAAGVTGEAGNQGKDLTDHGAIDGKPWLTRPDMLASALHLADHVREGSVEIIGESLAASLARLPRERLAALFPSHERPEAA